MTIADQMMLADLASKVPELEARLAKLEELVARASGEWEGRRSRIAEYQRERRAKLKAQRNG